MPKSLNVENHGAKKVVITGGSNGLGFELTKLYLALKFEVTIIDIVPPAIDEIKLTYYPCDLSNLSEIQETLQKITYADIVVNNAAIIVKKPFFQQTTQEITQQISINILAPTIIAKDFMQKNPKIQIVNISSSAAFIPTPNASIYGASKAFLSRLSNNLKSEMNEANIVNYELSGMKTRLQKNAGIKGADSRVLLDPQKVAQIILNKNHFALNQNFRIGITSKIFYLLCRAFPVKLSEKILGMLFRKLR
jgi:short-subunit dehydrogenase